MKIVTTIKKITLFALLTATLTPFAPLQAMSRNEAAAIRLDDVDLNGAAALGKTELFTLLLELGTDINKVNKANSCGATPLHCAAGRGHFDIVKTLLAYGANPNTADIRGETPLHCAAESGHFDIVNKLLDHWADINKAADNGSTPLYCAVAFRHHTNTVKALIERGANPNKAIKNGETPLDCATRNDNTEIVTLLNNVDFTCANGLPTTLQQMLGVLDEKDTWAVNSMRTIDTLPSNISAYLSLTHRNILHITNLSLLGKLKAHLYNFFSRTPKENIILGTNLLSRIHNNLFAPNDGSKWFLQNLIPYLRPQDIATLMSTCKEWCDDDQPNNSLLKRIT